jgi:general L-amino acid transport system permease protein
VLRLSNNWLVARLMTVYVEIFRNVPVLLWILLFYVVLSEAMPEPKDFRLTDAMIAAGETPKASMLLNDTVAITNRGMSVPAPLFDRGLGSVTIATIPFNLNFLAVLAVLIGSFLVNRNLLRQARPVQEDTGDRPVTWWKSILIWVAPVSLLLLALGFHLDYPALKGFNFTGGITVAHAFTALLIGLSLYTGAFIAEAVRSGILAISRGQTEAAYALGLRPGRTMSLVILPQALRVIIPPLISQYLNLTKNTSLAIAVSYMDLRGTLGGITLNQTGRELECMLMMMLVYLTICLLISSVMNIYNKAVQLKER